MSDNADYLHASSLHSAYTFERDCRYRHLLASGNGVVDSLVLLSSDLGLLVSFVQYVSDRIE